MLAENLVETHKPLQTNSSHGLHNVHFQERDENRTVDEPPEFNDGTLEIVIFHVLLPHKNGIVFKLKLMWIYFTEHESDFVDFDEEFDLRSEDESVSPLFLSPQYS